MYDIGGVPTSIDTFFMMSMTDNNDDDEECGDGLGVIGQAKASLRDPLRLLYRHPLHHSRHQHHHCHCHHHHNRLDCQHPHESKVFYVQNT